MHSLLSFLVILSFLRIAIHSSYQDDFTSTPDRSHQKSISEAGQNNRALKLPAFFTSNMVFQHDKPVRIWGKGKPGEDVSVTFAGKTERSHTGADSAWQVSFPPQKANRTPQKVTISSGTESIILVNILIGDVWIASGQSNMEWTMQKEMHFGTESKNAYRPGIRFSNPSPAGRYVYGVAYTDSLNRMLTTGKFYKWEDWQVCDSNTVKPFSAVAYYFAESVNSATGIPVGIINLSIGGAPAETFISRQAMDSDPRFSSKVQPGNWLDNESLPVWVRERGRQNVGGNNRAYSDDLGPNHAYKPGFAYDSGIKPLFGFPVKGVLWYQGESNSLDPERVDEYRELMKVLIDDYRKGWHDPEMPFYWVQLSSIDTVSYQSRYWPRFRDEQRRLLGEVKYGGMAVCSDIGFRNNVHPTNKKDVGERLARWALCDVYGKDVVVSGPLPLSATGKKGEIVVRFRYGDGLSVSDGNSLRGFSTDGRSDAEAVISGNKILIKTDKKPEYIYYGWKPYSDGNLVNGAGLPASTFKIKVR